MLEILYVTEHPHCRHCGKRNEGTRLTSPVTHANEMLTFI